MTNQITVSKLTIDQLPLALFGVTFIFTDDGITLSTQWK